MKVFGVETLLEGEFGEEGGWVFAVTDSPGKIAKIPGFKSVAFLGEIASSDGGGVANLFKVEQERSDTAGQAQTLACTGMETYHLAVDAGRLLTMDDIRYIEKLEPVIFL